MRWIFFTLIFALSSCHGSEGTKSSKSKNKSTHVDWQKFTPDIFEKAKKQDKFILLNLHANWCHWCHVMDDSTYSNPKIIQYLKEYYIPTSEDHDLRTDLAERYRAYGWPATIIFDAEGNEIVKRAGYIAPENFLRLLKAIVEDPSPEILDKQIAKTLNSSDEIFNTLDQKLKNITDETIGGFVAYQRSIHENTFRYALTQAKKSYWNNWTQKTAQNSVGLLDREWGGIYQYSTQKSWNHAHFEKLLAVQARYMQLYALYSSEFNDQEVLSRAKKIDQYVQQFLKSSNGLFFNAQDADLKKGKHSQHFFELDSTHRYREGIPAIDSNTYTKENAALGIAYLSLYGATNSRKYYNSAKIIHEKLAQRIQENQLILRSENISIFPIGDQTQFAFLSLLLYEVTGDKTNLNTATKITTAILNNYKKNEGYISFAGKSALPAEIIPRQNFQLARLLFKLSLYDENFIQPFKKIKNYLSQPEVLSRWNDEGAALLMKQWSREKLTKVEVFGNIQEEKHHELIAPVFTWPSTNYKVVFAAHEPTSQENFFGQNTTVLICGTSFCSMPFKDFSTVYQYWHQRLTFVKNE